MMRDLACLLLRDHGPQTNTGLAVLIREETCGPGTMMDAAVEERLNEWIDGIHIFGWQLHHHMLILEEEGRVERVQIKKPGARKGGTILWSLAAVSAGTSKDSNWSSDLLI